MGKQLQEYWILLLKVSEYKEDELLDNNFFKILTYTYKWKNIA